MTAQTATQINADPIATLEYVLPIVEEMERRTKRAPTECPWGEVAAQAIRTALKAHRS